jgi:DnaJ homolog subfamily B member 6
MLIRPVSQLYDQYGTWPPPTATAQPSAGPSFRQSSNPFSAFGPNNPFETDPFFTGRPFGRPAHMAYAFTDPFELFHSLFGDIHHMHDDFDDPFFGHSPFMSSPLGMSTPFGTGMGLHGSWGGPLTMAPFGPFAGRSMLSSFASSAAMAPNMRSYSSTMQSLGSGGHGGWVSQSTMTRSINGRTETITTRRDAQVGALDSVNVGSLLMLYLQG